MQVSRIAVTYIDKVNISMTRVPYDNAHKILKYFLYKEHNNWNGLSVVDNRRNKSLKLQHSCVLFPHSAKRLNKMLKEKYQLPTFTTKLCSNICVLQLNYLFIKKNTRQNYNTFVTACLLLYVPSNKILSYKNSKHIYTCL